MIAIRRIVRSCSIFGLCRAERNVIEAAAKGASTAITLVANVLAMLITFFAFIAFFNGVLSFLGSMVGYPELSFQVISFSLFNFEQPFYQSIKERKKYNISIAAPLLLDIRASDMTLCMRTQLATPRGWCKVCPRVHLAFSLFFSPYRTMRAYKNKPRCMREP